MRAKVVAKLLRLFTQEITNIVGFESYSLYRSNGFFGVVSMTSPHDSQQELHGMDESVKHRNLREDNRSMLRWVCVTNQKQDTLCTMQRF